MRYAHLTPHARHFAFFTSLALLQAAALAAPSSAAIDISGDPDRITLHYHIPAPARHAIHIGNVECDRWTIAGEVLSLARDAPALPRISRSVIIPDDAAMAVRVVDTDFYEITSLVAPSRGSIPRSVDPATVPYRFGPAYDVDDFFPGDLATLSDPYILRDHRGITVHLNPLQYNPVTGTLRIYTDITIEVAAAGPGNVNVLRRHRPVRDTTGAFQAIYRSHFLNYTPPRRYDPLNESGDLLIICHDPWLPHMQPFVEHKRAAGIDTTIIGVSEIGNDPDAIKAYVQDVYDTSNLSFLLLVGDAEHVTPAWAVSGEETGASDPTYSLLAGDDTYPDIIVGRFSADIAAHVLTQVDRTVTYERLPATVQDWFWRGIGAGSEQGPGDDGEMDYEHILIIRDWLLDYGYTHVDGFEDPLEVDMDLVRAAFNEGRGIFNFCGHGGPGGFGGGAFGWGVSDVDSMTNVNRLPFICCVACSTGDFADETCIGEWFLWATHNGQPTGAVGFYGSTVGQWWSEPMEAQDEFNLVYTAEQYATYGALCYAGSCSMMDKYGPGSSWMFLTWHIFGDPSLRVVGTIPPITGLDVQPFSSLVSGGPDGGPFDPTEITYTLTNASDAPIQWTAGTDAAWLDLSHTAGILLPDDSLDVTVSINDAAETLPDGEYIAAIQFINHSDGDAVTTRIAILDVGQPVPVHVFNLDEQPNWTMEEEWAFGQPTGGGAVEYGNPDPTSGATGPNVFGVNLEGDYSIDSGGPYFLTTAAIDCLNLERTTLHFQRWLNTDLRPYVTADIEVSDDGVNWTTIWQNPGSEIVDSDWAEYEYDISHAADLSPTVFIRWSYAKDGPAYPYSGWNIDDIAIWGNDVDVLGMHVLPECDFQATGPYGGPFTPDSIVYSLSNLDDEPIDFTVDCTAPWLTASPSAGTIPVKNKVKVTISINSLADDLPNGFYQAPIAITNHTTHEGDTTRLTNLDINQPATIHAVPLDTHPGWSMTGEWAFGQPTGQGGAEHGFPDPTSGATGLNVCGVNLNGDYSIEPGPPYHLTTTAFDCSGLHGVALAFKRWLNSDYQDYVFATIEASANGIDWLPVWDNGTGEIAEQEWSEQVYDISAIADDQPAVYLRWGYDVNDAAYPYSGWNIDDVEIRAMVLCPADVVADGVVDTLDLLALLAAWGDCPPPDCPADITADGHVDVLDLLQLLAAWGPC